MQPPAELVPAPQASAAPVTQATSAPTQPAAIVGGSATGVAAQSVLPALSVAVG